MKRIKENYFAKYFESNFTNISKIPGKVSKV